MLLKSILWACVFTLLCCQCHVYTEDDTSCVQESSCVCTDKTSGFRVDLNHILDEVSTTPRFQVPNGTYTYLYQPCVPFSDGEHCENVAACQKSLDGTQVHNIGKDDSAKFVGDFEAGTLSLTYSSMDEDARITTVKLICRNSEKSELKVLKENPEKTYNFELLSKQLCTKSGSKGLSLGSILLIIFFVLIVVYLIGGALFLRFYRGARGVEQIPNYEFWTELPGYIKEGILFTINGCKKDTAYEQI